MIRNLRLPGSALVLLVLLAACGNEDEPAGATDPGTPTATEAVATPDAWPTAEASPIATETAVPATQMTEATSTPSIDPPATFTPIQEETLDYGWMTAWDAKWERLGAMALGPDGRLYIDDYVHDQLMVFTTDGTESSPVPYVTEHPGIAEAGSDLAIGPDGRLYLLEQAGGTWIKVFEPDGTLVKEWGGTLGFDDESLFDAGTIAVAPDGHIFTTRAGQLLQKFTNDGEFVAAWDRAGEHLFPLEVYDMDAADGALYLAVAGLRDEQNAILTFDFDGNLIAEPLVVGEGDDEDRIVPWSLAIGPDGNLFVADVFRREVIILTPAGDELARWPLEATDQRFPSVEIAVDDAGHVYVADDAQNAIVVYAPDTGNSTDGPRQEPSLAANPDRFPCGTPVDIIGKGFPPDAPVTLVENSQAANAVWEQVVTADSEGTFTTEFWHEIEAACLGEIGLEGLDTTIDALVDGELVATAPFTIFPFDRRAGLQLSSSEVSCDDILTLTGVNFEPGTDAVVTVGVEGGHQTILPGQLASVNDDGGFDLELDISQFRPCLSGSFDEPQEYIVWATTDRAKQGSSPFGYPSQRATITLLPPGE